jgi:hypothetical protein
MKKETIEFLSQEEKDAILQNLDNIIKKARMLNKTGRKSASNPMHGTEYLHTLLRKGAIDNRIYAQMVRIAEDQEIEYTIVL